MWRLFALVLIVSHVVVILTDYENIMENGRRKYLPITGVAPLQERASHAFLVLD